MAVKQCISKVHSRHHKGPGMQLQVIYVYGLASWKGKQKYHKEIAMNGNF